MKNVVARMCRTSGHKLYFHEVRLQGREMQSEKKYEIDFLLVKNKKICLVEVKSSGYRGQKSFDALREKYLLKMQEGYIIHTKDLRVGDNACCNTLYMTKFIFLMIAFWSS